MKKPTGREKGLAEREFELQRSKIRQNDISSELIDKLQEYLHEFILLLRSRRERAFTDRRQARIGLIMNKVRERDRNNKPTFRIHGFRAFIKHPRKDYFLGQLQLQWAGTDQTELLVADLFLSLDMLSKIRSYAPAEKSPEACREIQEALLRKWLLFEMTCEVFGEETALKVIDKHYPAGSLKQTVKSVLSEQENPWDSQQSRMRRFQFEGFDLQIPPQAGPCMLPLGADDVRARLGDNWFYQLAPQKRKTGDLTISGKREVIQRLKPVRNGIRIILEQTDLLDDEGGIAIPLRVIVLGSYFWCGEFIEDTEGNTEVFVIVDGDRDLDRSRYLTTVQAKKLLGIEKLGRAKVRVRITLIGTQQLERASSGAVKGRDEIRRMLVLLPHEGIQVLGEPLELRPRHSAGIHQTHLENIAGITEMFREELAHCTKQAERDWMGARLKAIDAYAQHASRAAAKVANNGMPALEAVERGKKPGLLGRALRAILPPRAASTSTQNPGRTASGAANKTNLPPADIDMEATNRQVSLKLKSTEPLTEEPEEGRKLQSMITFYGVPMTTNDTLHGYSGSYRIKKRLGEGAQGAVWRSEQLDERGNPVRELALKIPSRHPEWEWNKEAEWRALVGFNKEIHALDRLAWHPNIIRLHDWYREDGDIPFYVMEAVSGHDLNDYFANRDFDEREIVSVFSKLADGLQASHGEGLTHRDLKPENIMIRDSDHEPVILDFGTASDIEYSESLELTAVGAAKGTPVYMAPEMAARLVREHAPYLVIERDSAFGANGSTRQYRRDDIIDRIDRAEGRSPQPEENARARRPGLFTRMRFHLAVWRVQPVLDMMYAHKIIHQQPTVNRLRILDCSEITFGAFVLDQTMYVEKPFLRERPFERILIGSPELEHKQDIFTLGVMLYQRLTWPISGPEPPLLGRLPFVLPEDRSDLWGAVLARLQKDYFPVNHWRRTAPEKFHQISPCLEVILERMLSINPRDRYDAKELKDEFNLFLSSANDAAPQERSREYDEAISAHRMYRASRWLCIGVIGALVAAFLSFTFIPDLPDRLVPKASQVTWFKVFETSVHAGHAIVFGVLAVITIAAAIMVMALVLKPKLHAYASLQEYLRHRLRKLERLDQMPVAEEK